MRPGCKFSTWFDQHNKWCNRVSGAHTLHGVGRDATFEDFIVQNSTHWYGHRDTPICQMLQANGKRPSRKTK